MWIKLDDFDAVETGKTRGIESPRWRRSHLELFIWIWINAVGASSVDDEVEEELLVALALDDEQDKNGRLRMNIVDVVGANESFSIWFRLKSEKCLSMLDLMGIIASGNEGSARTTCRNCCSLIAMVLNGSGDEDRTDLRAFFKTGWCGNDRRANGVRRMYGDETVLLTPPVLAHFDDGDEMCWFSS